MSLSFTAGNFIMNFFNKLEIDTMIEEMSSVKNLNDSIISKKIWKKSIKMKLRVGRVRMTKNREKQNKEKAKIKKVKRKNMREKEKKKKQLPVDKTKLS